MAPSAGAVVVVANTHCTSFGIQNVCAMAFGVHPGIHDFFRRNAAPCGILASSGIRHAVLAENSVPLGTIGTNVRIDGCDLFSAPLSSCGELCIVHDQGLQPAFGCTFCNKNSTGSLFRAICAVPYSLHKKKSGPEEPPFHNSGYAIEKILLQAITEQPLLPRSA